jgi:hypothetical protein
MHVKPKEMHLLKSNKIKKVTAFIVRFVCVCVCVCVRKRERERERN